MATFSKSTRKLDELKKEVVEVLLSCDGHRLDLGQFKPEYKRKFRMEFNRKRYALRKGSGGKLINIMGEISDVVSLETVDSAIVIVLKEDSTFVRNKSSSEERHKSNQKAPLPSTAKKKGSSTTAEVTSSLPPPKSTPTISFAAINNELAKKGTALSQEISQSIDAADRERDIPEEDGSLYTPPFGNVLSASSPLLSPPGQRSAGPISTPDLAPLMDSERCTISGNIVEGEQATGHVTQMARPSYWGLLGTPPLACSMLSGGGELSQQSFACSPRSDGLEQKNALQGKQAKPVTVPPRMPHSPYMGLLGSPPSGSTFPTLPPPIIGQNLSPGAVGFGVIATPPQTMETRRNLTTSPAVSLRSIMEQQAQEEKSARNIPVSPFLDSKDMKDDRVRKIGEPGPFEDSFNQAQRIQANSSQAKPARNATLLEVNKVTENIIRSLSEEGRYVSLEVVKAKLCCEFGKSSIKALGFRRDVDIPALQELIKLQAKVSLFVHAYVMSNSISTLYELNQSVADLLSKPDFQELNLGPLLKQPVVYDLFKAPQDLPSVPHITTIHILKHLEKYMDREDLWRKKVDLKKFLEYLCEEYRFETPYELGVRIQSIGLAISVIKTAKGAGSRHWKAAREQISEDTVAEIEAHLRKIKRDLLGQEVGDLRSRALKLLDASPVDVLHQIFSCCEELFDGKRHSKVAKFLTMVTSDSLGRRLFQLALHVGCSRLIGPMPEEACVVAGHAQSQEKDSTQDSQSNKPVPPSEGKLVEEVKQWLTQADTLDLPRLARIEGTIVRKSPAFSGFEAFGYGSFLHFLAKHKELLEAVDEVGGMARAGGDGSRLGLRVSLSSILDFISQCGTHTSPDVIERSLCTYYGVSKVTDLGLGSCSRLLQKAAERRQNPAGINTHSIVYEAALLCNDAVKREGGTGDTEPHHGAVLGWKSKEEAMTAIRGSPLLEDVAQWTHWDEVFGGHVSKLGDLSTFLENEKILMNVGKSSSQSGDAIVVMETSPGELLRVTKDTSPEMFHQCVSRGDALGTAGHLVSMVIVNGGVSNTPVALLANHVRSSLALLASSEASGYSQCSGFVLDCLLRIPRRLAKAVGAKVFLEPLKEIAGSTQAPELLISSCSSQSQRSRLHQLGFVLGVNQWIEDFQRRISSSEEDHKDVATHQEKKQNRPIAVVKPVPPPREIIKQKLDDEESDDALRNAVEDSSREASIADEMDSGAEDTSPKASTPCVDQQEECRALIEQIRREDFGIGLVLGEEESKLVNRQREREGRGLHRLSTELYSRDTHFVLELVQNADDNSYSEECTGAGHPSLVFILQPDKIVVLNNEEGFEEKNIRALCDVGRSTKGAHRYGYIGQKGIGFKSVFRVSDSPEVHSNGFHIRFDAKSGPIGYILPQWIDENTKARERGDEEEEGEEEIQGTDRVQEQEEAAQESQAGATEDEFEGWATRIVLPLKDEHQGVERSSLAARFRDVHPSLLLFLHRLRRITIQDKTNNIHREMVRRDLGENVMEVCHTDGTDRWLVIKKQFDSSKIKEDIEMTELALAFPLLNDTNSSQHEAMGRRHQTLPQQNVFAYLPLRSYGFRFIIQGDFEVPSSREDVDTDKPWNQWLREEIPPLFIEALNVFMGHSSFFGLSSVAAYFQFVPLEEEILDFFTPVARHILKLLQGTPCMPVIRTSKVNDQPSSSSGEDSSDSYEWVLPCKAIVCHDSTTLELITPALLEEHLGLFYLHPAMTHALNPTLRSRLGIETLSSKHLIEIGKAEVKKASSQSSVTLPHSAGGTPNVARIGWVARWLQCVYRCLEQERDSSQDVLDVIGSLSVVPLTDGTFVHLKGDSLFFPLSLKKTSEKSVRKKKAASGKTSQEQSNFSVLEEDLSTVHPALFSSLDDIGRSQVEELLKRLGVKSWTPRELINSHILPAFKSDKWKAKSNKVLTSYLVYIHEQRLTDLSVCDVDDLRSCVQILTNKGVSNPSETPVHFTPKYGNNIDLARQLPSISWALIDDSYLTSTAHIHELTVFLAELGVKRFLAITRKQVKLDRNSMAQSPWSSAINIWPTTPDGLYLVDDWACDEFEEFIGKIVTSENNQLVSPEESRILAECIDEQWDNEYAKFADDPVRYKDTNGHVLGETQSSFYLNLVSKPWMASGDGRSSTRAEVTPSLFQPKELFVRTESVCGLLEDHVKYVAANLKSHAFVNALRIRESVNVDELLKEMTRWSSNAEKASQGNQARGFTTSLAHMRRVYHFLLYRSQEAADKRTIEDAFHRNALIFIPDQSLDSSSVQSQANHQCPRFFYKKKEVCWRDPTGVALKLTKEHRKATTRHLLEQHYSNSQPSISAFFIGELNVDETPNMDEYIEMAAAVSEVSGFPSPSSLDSMFKIFSILGRKCVARGHNDSIRVEAEIDENMSSFLKQRLGKEQKMIFPSLDRWVALSDKPLVPDDKTLEKIFQKEKGVYFLDLGNLFRPPKARSSSRVPNHEREEIQANVSLFLRACMVQNLTECVKNLFVPEMVQYQCVPLQKYFHQMIPSVQRFLYSKMPDLYMELKHKGFAQKLSEMKFATVKSLETVYSLSTHPEVCIPVEEKSGVEVVGSSYCFYVMKEHQSNFEVFNAEMVKLFQVGKKTSSEFSNFLVAVGSYQGNDLEHFLEEMQGLESLPEEEELWCVPPPEEPDIPEIEKEEEPTEVFPSLYSAAATQSKGDNELHSWPPKSSSQFDGIRRGQGAASTDDTLKMWPPPAPPDSVKVETREDQNQEKPGQQGNSTIDKPKEKDGMIIEHECPVQVAPGVQNVPSAMGTEAKSAGDRHFERTGINHTTATEGKPPEHCNEPLAASDERARQGQPDGSSLQQPEHPTPAGDQITPTSRLTGPRDGVKQQSFQSFLFRQGPSLDISFEELPLDSDVKMLKQIDFKDNPNKEEVGRWGEQAVFEFLMSQAKYPPQGEEVEIRWMNEAENTTAPYDFEILRRSTGMECNASNETVTTYIEVKTTSSNQKEVFEISAQELLFALEKRDALHLYRVFNAGQPSRVRLLRLQNVAAHLEKKSLKLCMVI